MERITDITRITEALDPTGAIETYIWDEILNCQWETVGQIINQLELASCAAGSWSGMIYTRDILDRLANPQWVADIEQAIEDYTDATGESPTFDPYGSGFSLSSVVTFAVDWVAYEIASRLRSLDQVAVVTASVDSMDPQPERIAFASVWEAEDWVAEEVERRVSHRVQHHSHTVTEQELDEWRDDELRLMALTEERL